MTDIKASAWTICERVAEAQALLHDHTEGGRFTADELVRKLAALMAEEGLLRAMWEVGGPELDRHIFLSMPGRCFGLPLYNVKACEALAERSGLLLLAASFISIQQSDAISGRAMRRAASRRWRI